MQNFTRIDLFNFVLLLSQFFLFFVHPIISMLSQFCLFLFYLYCLFDSNSFFAQFRLFDFTNLYFHSISPNDFYRNVDQNTDVDVAVFKTAGNDMFICIVRCCAWKSIRCNFSG